MPEPLLLPVPELGCLGAVVLPDAPLLGELLLGVLLEVLPLVPPLEAAPAPDFLKCASHSSREIWPSLFLSTDEKLGAWLLAPPEAPAFGALEAPPAALLSDLPAALAPEDAPEVLSKGLLSAAPALGALDFAASPLVLCARATPPSAKSAAAVAVLTTLTNMGEFLLGELGRTAARAMQ